MNVAEKICEKAKDLPEPVAKEVLDFIERVYSRKEADIEELKKAQAPAMNQIWENKEDDVWNSL